MAKLRAFVIQLVLPIPNVQPIRRITMRHNPDQDRNFDDLAERFVERIYGSTKGALRLAILQRDLAVARQRLPEGSLRVLDAGGGAGHFSSLLAREGHEIVFSDISENMIHKAKERFAQQAPRARVSFHHGAVQSLRPEEVGAFDLILSHAVAEWVVQPLHMLEQLLKLLKPNGLISFMYYNKDAAIFRNLLYGHLDRLPADEIRGDKKSLTPFNPMLPEIETEWFARRGYESLVHSGIRCFSDYLMHATRKEMDEKEIFHTELKLSQLDPYRSFGRYIHKIYYKSENKSR